MEEDRASAAAAVYCARHPREETAITCASCGTPICPKCMVTTPVGMKCPDCGRSRNSVLYQVRPERLVLVGIVSLLAGVVAAIIGKLGFLVIFLAFPYGYFAGSVILRASGMKRGLKLEILAGTAMVLGALALKFVPPLLMGRLFGEGARSAVTLALPLLLDPFFWVALVIATACAVSKIRYL